MLGDGGVTRSLACRDERRSQRRAGRAALLRAVGQCHFPDVLARLAKGDFSSLDGNGYPTGQDQVEVVVRAGEVLVIPSHVVHMAEALEDTLDLDIFSPPRQDWIDKTDDYMPQK